MNASPQTTIAAVLSVFTPRIGRSLALSRDHDVDDLAMLVAGAVDVPPDTADLHIGLVHEPPVTDWMPARTHSFGEQRR